MSAPVPVRAARTAAAGVALLALHAALYAATLVGVLALPWWPARLACGVINGCFIAALMLVGHDAGHGSLTPWPRLNAVLGRLALLPCFHPLAGWQRSHNRVHHAFTNLRGYDYVWAPWSKEEFDRLPRWRRLLERGYRTVPGLGLYYLVELWWRHTFLWHRGRLTARPGKAAVLDRALVLAFAVGQAVGLCHLQRWLAARLGVPALTPGAVLAQAVALPFATFCWLGGLCTFLHHSHPRLRWFDSRAEWSNRRGALEGTAHVVFPWPINLLTHNVMDHTIHHLDPRVPLVRLAAAQRGLEASQPGVVTEPFCLAALWRTLRVCQLYDYRRHCWLAFDGTPTT